MLHGLRESPGTLSNLFRQIELVHGSVKLLMLTFSTKLQNE